MKANTITMSAADAWLRSRETDCYCTNTPIYYSMRILDAHGEEWNEVDETEAVYAEFTVEDYDNAHDFDFLRLTLAEVGAEINREDMLDAYELMKIEREEESRPLKAAEIIGDGELGRSYCYQLILKK